MSDLRDWSPEPNGSVLEERSPSSTEYWQIAEEATQGIISHVQPTVVSEERRKAVIDYVQRLISNCLGCAVYPFGSVPLKTYLPDGDIDLTAFGGLNVEEALANNVCSVLEREDQNRDAEFIVKDAQLIRAEVKLVKCLVQNIVVDISFNQLGGICTLCFLEQVDRLIGKDHLFKRSIILIKAWCYYESRILGAHHGLISTYALETLVLYIFHLFHSSLNGPLAVLYKFLEYFSKFDWDNYCISLNGPVRISSLPEVVVEIPENGGDNLLLSSEFLKGCAEEFSVPSRGFETNSRTFPPKHFNIVDPLKENNNLGRSVSKGNFYRIRSAFTYGAQKLGRILSQPEESLADELRKFFSNTLDRHGSEQRPDIQDPVPMSRHNESGATSTFSGRESYQEQSIYESESTHSSGIAENCRSDHEGPLHAGIGNVKLVGMDSSYCRIVNDSHGSVDRTTVSEKRLYGDAKDLATSKIQSLKISNDVPKSCSPTGEESNIMLGKAYHAPHLYFSHSMGNGEMTNGNTERKQPIYSGFAEKKVSSGISSAHCKETGLSGNRNDQNENYLSVNDDVLSPVGSKHHPYLTSTGSWPSEDLNYGYSSYQASPRTAGSTEALNSLSDLSGDYESHKKSLDRGRQWYEQALNPSYSPMSQFHNNNLWDIIPWSLPFRGNVIPQMNANGVVPRPIFYPINPPILPGASFAMEEMPKARGTGTYFPNTTHYRDRPLIGRGRNQVRSPRNNGRVITSSERSSREQAPGQFHVHQSGGKPGISDLCQSGSPENKAQPNSNGSRHNLIPTAQPNSNGSMHSSDKVVESGSIAHTSLRAISPESSSRQPNTGSAVDQNPSVSLSSPGMQKSKPLVGSEQDMYENTM